MLGQYERIIKEDGAEVYIQVLSDGYNVIYDKGAGIYKGKNIVYAEGFEKEVEELVREVELMEILNLELNILTMENPENEKKYLEVLKRKFYIEDEWSKIKQIIKGVNNK